MIERWYWVVQLIVDCNLFSINICNRQTSNNTQCLKNFDPHLQRLQVIQGQILALAGGIGFYNGGIELYNGGILGCTMVVLGCTVVVLG